MVGAVAGGVIAAINGKNVWPGIGIGAAAGALEGAGAGAEASALITGSAVTNTAVVLGTASTKLAATGTSLGIAASKAIDKVSSGYEKVRSTLTGTTNVYRSVSAAELTDISSTGKFNLVPGGLEAKQFAFSYAETLKFGSQRIINQTSVVRASVPNSMVDCLKSPRVDAGIFTNIITVDYSMLGMFNEAVSGTIRIMP